MSTLYANRGVLHTGGRLGGLGCRLGGLLSRLGRLGGFCNKGGAVIYIDKVGIVLGSSGEEYTEGDGGGHRKCSAGPVPYAAGTTGGSGAGSGCSRGCGGGRHRIETGRNGLPRPCGSRFLSLFHYRPDLKVKILVKTLLHLKISLLSLSAARFARAEAASVKWFPKSPGPLLSPYGRNPR